MYVVVSTYVPYLRTGFQHVSYVTISGKDNVNRMGNVLYIWLVLTTLKNRLSQLKVLWGPRREGVGEVENWILCGLILVRSPRGSGG